ncbi:hypothetical protein B9Z55_009101 [Caenorhabditis nigoni]|uniref:RING-type domain-containing protein n=1 Tax=Caenorhabditis nigoni TaxID=1611254 RepID=A0A2G5UQT8_9PELO|nr:hypothetical protein B9Z55_009101 [Caenorhabditis nigoni]
MSISTQSFKETKLVDYCDREGIVTTSSKENDPDGKWKIAYPIGEALSSNFDFFLEEELEKGSIKFFVLDDSDVRWIHETLKLSGGDKELIRRKEELKTVLKSLTDFVNHRENKRIYIREVWMTSENPSERRRVFTEEVLEIIPIILKQQNSNLEEWNDLLQKHRLDWERKHVHYSINMETFGSVLEVFHINKGLITIVPDPIYEMSIQDMLEFGRQTAMRLSPDGKCLLDSSHAILYIFQSVVYAVNWKKKECEPHENCKLEARKNIMGVMKDFRNNPEGVLIPIDDIRETVKRVRSQCDPGPTGLLRLCVTLNPIDQSRYSEFVDYDQKYQPALYAYDLPDYRSLVDFSTSPNSETGEIPTWLVRVLLLAGWTEQFFDKETVDLANVILRLIMKKIPAELRQNIVFLLKNVQASIAGVNFVHPPGTKLRWNPAVEVHQKMLKKAQERAEKIRKRKELSKSGKVKNPSSTTDVRPITETSEETNPTEIFVGASLLEKQEYPESKLTIRKNESFEIGNVPNVLSLDNTGVLETVALKNSCPGELYTIAEGEEKDVTSTDEEDELESKEVKMLKKEVERLKTFEEKAAAIDELEKEYNQLNGIVLEHKERHHKMLNDISEKNSKIMGLLEEKTKKVDKLEHKTRSLELEVERLKGFERAADEMKKEKKAISIKLKDVEKKRDSDIKKMAEEKKKLKISLDERTMKSDEMEKKIKLSDSEMNQMRSELNRLKKQSEDQEKLLNENNTAIERLKSEVENSKSSLSEKETEIVRLNNELFSKSTETNESLVIQLSRLEEETWKRKKEEKEKNEVILKSNEQLQTTVRHLSIQNEDQQKTIQNLYGRLAMAPSQPVSSQEEKPESLQSQISAIQNLCGRFLSSADSEELKQFRITLQRLRNIKDRFQNKDQLKLARTMTDKLITMSNRSEIRELALYEYQQYEANFQNYTQLVDLNIEKMKETRDCSLYSPLPKPPAFSDRFMNEYWLECDKKKKELEMDISDSECLICFFEMNSDQKTLKCDHCKKITHLKCASKWLQIHRSCPHCRREQLDPEEFPALS